MIMNHRSASDGISSTQISNQRSTDSCNLCFKLFPANCHFSHSFSSGGMTTINHAYLHSEQNRRIDNIFIQPTAVIIDQIDPEIIDHDHNYTLRNSLNLSANETNQLSYESAQRKKIGFLNYAVPKISLIVGGDGQLTWTGIENIRPLMNDLRMIRCHMYSAKMITIVDKAGKQIKLNEIILHVTEHLIGINLYSCNICDYSTNVLKNMHQHHFEEHLNIEPKMVESNYFTANYVMHKSALLQIIKKCLGFELIDCDSMLEELEKCHESATEFRLILLKKQLADNGNKWIKCRICNQGISFIVIEKGKSCFRGKAFISHIQSHLINKSIFRCLFCAFSTSTVTGICRHLKKHHSHLLLKGLRNYYVDESAKFDKEIDKMLFECFQFQRTDDDDQNVPQGETNCYWSELRKKMGEKQRIRCAVCLTCIPVKRKNKKHFDYNSIVRHISLHLDSYLPIYTCNLCNETAVTLWSICRHLQLQHSDINSSFRHMNYKNNTMQFQPEICAAMKKCFDYLPNNLVAKTVKTCSAIVPTKGAVESLCDELIKNSANEFDRLECQVCSKEFIAASDQQCRSAITKHAIMHTDLPLYECNICTFELNSYDKIKRHLSKEHKLESKTSNHFRYNRKKFENEIIVALKQCFQKKAV